MSITNLFRTRHTFLLKFVRHYLPDNKKFTVAPRRSQELDAGKKSMNDFPEKLRNVLTNKFESIVFARHYRKDLLTEPLGRSEPCF